MSTSTPPTAAPPPRPSALERAKAARRTTTLAGAGFLAPFAVFFIGFLIVPTVWGLWLSFTDQSLTGAGGEFIGLANYAEALGDGDMWRSLGNTAWFTILTTIPLVAIALVMAILVDMGLPGQWLWRLSYFLPYLLASTVVSQFWIWMFNPQLGIVNGALAAVGVDGPAWLQDPSTAMISVVIATVWWTVGFNFLLYLAALQNIPAHHYEAASLDGAGRWRQLTSITIPQLAPTTVLVLILQVLASLKVFDQIFQMTEGGPAGATRPVLQYVYETGFTGFRFGYSSAISYVFFALIVIVSIAQFSITRRKR